MEVAMKQIFLKNTKEIFESHTEAKNCNQNCAIAGNNIELDRHKKIHCHLRQKPSVAQVGYPLLYSEGGRAGAENEKRPDTREEAAPTSDGERGVQECD
ncbi:hypothetical protein CDAR_278451 [Caerostris darwini]|uniref:C2H2-type domain-containing protein n=1 Tax=Caerostris darwini TaxID=1538125 RepID=A0AAV4WR43_9ARAC|nr:hypothetical protein CDAR_278451 [Caerostris darwini]